MNHMEQFVQELEINATLQEIWKVALEKTKLTNELCWIPVHMLGKVEGGR